MRLNELLETGYDFTEKDLITYIRQLKNLLHFTMTSLDDIDEEDINNFAPLIATIRNLSQTMKTASSSLSEDISHAKELLNDLKFARRTTYKYFKQLKERIPVIKNPNIKKIAIELKTNLLSMHKVLKNMTAKEKINQPDFIQKLANAFQTN